MCTYISHITFAETHTDTDRHTDTDSETQTDIYTHTTHTHQDTDSDTGRHIYTQRHTGTKGRGGDSFVFHDTIEPKKQTQTQTHIYAHTDTLGSKLICNLHNLPYKKKKLIYNLHNLPYQISS
jgi:hypothetical protein